MGAVSNDAFIRLVCKYTCITLTASAYVTSCH